MLECLLSIQIGASDGCDTINWLQPKGWLLSVSKLREEAGTYAIHPPYQLPNHCRCLSVDNADFVTVSCALIGAGVCCESPWMGSHLPARQRCRIIVLIRVEFAKDLGRFRRRFLSYGAVMHRKSCSARSRLPRPLHSGQAMRLPPKTSTVVRT